MPRLEPLEAYAWEFPASQLCENNIVCQGILLRVGAPPFMPETSILIRTSKHLRAASCRKKSAATTLKYQEHRRYQGEDVDGAL